MSLATAFSCLPPASLDAEAEAAETGAGGRETKLTTGALRACKSEPGTRHVSRMACENPDALRARGS